MAAGFRFSRVVVVESLEAHEFASGTRLVEYLQTQLGGLEASLPVVRVSCESAIEFRDTMSRLTAEAARGEIPLLHVECHGDEGFGLEFSNGSTLGWEELSLVLERLNRATHLNLVAVFAACFGAHFAAQLVPLRGAPCFALIAPTHTVDAGEILGSFREFYTTLFRSLDAGQAAAAVVKRGLSTGTWFADTAERWFVTMITTYVQTHVTWDAMIARAESIRSKVPPEARPGRARALRQLRKAQQQELRENYFKTYFLVAEFPHHEARFCEAQRRLTSALDEFAQTGRYVL